MTLRALFYAYILGGITLIPLTVAGLIFFTIYTSVPVPDARTPTSAKRGIEAELAVAAANSDTDDSVVPLIETNDLPRTRKGWLTVRRTFEEYALDGSYVTLVRSFLDARSKDPKRSRPKDMWYVVLKGKVLYLYEDEQMTECEAAIELGGHDIVIYPENLLDGELFTRRNAICLKPKAREADKSIPILTEDMKYMSEDINVKVEQTGTGLKRQEKVREKVLDAEKKSDVDGQDPWFIFVRTTIDMEDWYFALIHASDHPPKMPSLTPLMLVFQPLDMDHLVTTLDEQPDVIPTRWLNALLGRIFFSFYRTHILEAYIIGRLMKKLSRVKRPTFLTDIVVTEVSVGNRAPTFSKPMLKELTKEGDGAMEVHFHYKGEFRITIEATAIISLGTFKSYNVKLALAAVLKELEGNLLIKIRRPPSNRIWYAFTQTPRMVLAVEPIVSDRQITWSMILSTIEARLREIIQESVVMPNMDDIAFFDSTQYHHRGGIWQDASRRERPVSPLAEQATNEDPSNSTTSTLDISPAQVEESTIVPVPLLAEVPTAVDALSVTPLPPPLDNTLPTPIYNGIAEQPPVPKQNRRRSWFSSVRSDDANILPRMDALVDAELDDDQRGRSAQSDKVKAPFSRSQSAPNKPESVLSNSFDQEQDVDNGPGDLHLSPESARRSASRHSINREHVESTPIGSSIDSVHITTPPSKKVVNNGGTSSSPSSFLSTLKHRAGDKQALSNTAKEAMRKWGVNWGGLKKEPTNGEDPDHISIASAIGSKLRPEGNTSVATKARASYAEVRAAVAERRGRDKRLSDSGEDLDRSQSSSPIPIPIPGGSKPKERAASNPWLETEATQASANPSSQPDSIALSISSGSSNDRHVSLGEMHGTESRRSMTPSTSHANADGDGQDPLVAPHLTPAIVHVQPKAMTMTIPGIHASHRGEVMSMGYNAPPKPPSVTPSEGKSTIQSVYRLWKSPGLSGDPQQQSQTPSSQQTLVQQYHDIIPTTELDKNVDPLNIASTTPPSPYQPMSRPVPPPLPPRSTPAHAMSRPEVESPTSRLTPTSASETLKGIADRDELSRRNSLENNISPSTPVIHVGSPDSSPTKISLSSSNSAPPPLPPRRIPV